MRLVCAMGSSRTTGAQLHPILPLTHPHGHQLVRWTKLLLRLGLPLTTFPYRCWLRLTILRHILNCLVSSVSTATSHWMKLMVLCGTSRMASSLEVTVSKETCSNTLALSVSNKSSPVQLDMAQRTCTALRTGRIVALFKTGDGECHTVWQLSPYHRCPSSYPYDLFDATHATQRPS
jgi:hypothetical protein